MSLFQEYTDRWKEQVNVIAASGYYAKKDMAERFFVRHVAAAWQGVLQVSEDDDLATRFGMTPTQKLLLHVFGKGVVGVASKNTRAPRFKAWPPSHDKNSHGRPICYRVVPTSDLAKITRRSRSAVDDALRRFKRTGADDLVDHGLCNVISTEAGVALDGIFQPQMSFPFAYAVHEYEHGKDYAQEQRVQQSAFYERQTRWCREGIAAKGGSVVKVRPVPVEQAELRGLA